MEEAAEAAARKRVTWEEAGRRVLAGDEAGERRTSEVLSPITDMLNNLRSKMSTCYALAEWSV